MQLLENTYYIYSLSAQEDTSMNQESNSMRNKNILKLGKTDLKNEEDPFKTAFAFLCQKDTILPIENYQFQINPNLFSSDESTKSKNPTRREIKIF